MYAMYIMYDETAVFSCNVGIIFYNGKEHCKIHIACLFIAQHSLTYLFIMQQKGSKATIFCCTFWKWM